MSGITLHGIPNCDTVKRARTWLAAQGVDYAFHDFKKAGVPDALPLWAEALGWERLLNRSGSTWRKLDEAQRAAVTDAAGAVALMRAQPSVIKRPVVQWDNGAVSVGFDADDWARRLSSQCGSPTLPDPHGGRAGRSPAPGALKR